jgi:septum site-determining protein MinD
VDRHFLPETAMLMKLLHSLSYCYDVMILDAPAGIGRMFDAAAAVCDASLVVTQCDPIALRDASIVVSMLRGRAPRLVVNRFMRRQLLGENRCLDQAIDRGGRTMIAVVPEDGKAAAAVPKRTCRHAGGACNYRLARRLRARKFCSICGI